nr:aspartyl-phosphate phosphatase Spo0E family protein [Salirhabdus euzebyi]
MFLEIQKKREKMHYTADHYGLESSQTLSVSQELDKLINVYLKQKLERVNF